MTVWRKLSSIASSVTDSGRQFVRGLFGSNLPALRASHDSPETSVAFTMAVVALGAKMARADGVVVPVEVDMFHRVFRVEGDQAANVARLFKLAQQDTAGYEVYALKVEGMLRHDPLLLRDVLESLFHIATADRALHPGEDVFLHKVGAHFGFTDSEYRHIRAQFVVDDSSPYDVLGLDPKVSNDILKKRHRELVRETHPDIMIGRGLPPEMIEVATRRLTAINNAYAVIARERKL